MQITFIVLIILLLTPFFFIERNERVFKERQRMIEWVFEQSDWEEKKKLLKNPSYNDMVYKFWKPVKSFYKEYLN